MAKLIAYNKAMNKANIAELKNHLSSYLALVEKGEAVEICKRNVPIARLIPIAAPHRNQTKLGCGSGSVKIHATLTEPFMPESDWNMLNRNDQ